jgi:anti-sigma regulatory factor (Ser/Thr protein kinase)
MLDTVINAIKVLFSKSARETGASLIARTRQHASWKRDIVVSKAIVSNLQRERTQLLRESIVDQMLDKGYFPEAIGAFQTCFSELVTNCFEHGIIHTNQRVGILAEVSKSFVTLTVRNPRGSPFDPISAVNQQFRRLTRNPLLPRGRGLLTVRGLADEYWQTADHRGIKIVIYRDRVVLQTFGFEGLTVIRLASGLFNSSCGRRIENEVMAHINNDVILDLSRWVFHDSTSVRLRILALRKVFEETSSEFIALVALNNSGVHLPTTLAVKSWREALTLLGKPAFEEQIREAFPPLPTEDVNDREVRDPDGLSQSPKLRSEA